MADGIASRFDKYPDPATTPAYSAADERLLETVAMHSGGPVLSRAGVRPGPGLDVTTGGSPESVTVSPGGGIATDTGAGGSFTWVLPAAVTIQLPVRPGSGTSRIDELVLVVKNDAVRPADGAREVDVQLLSGAASGSPTPPSIPAGALRLRRLTVPATGSVALALPPQRTAAAGGTLLVATQAEEDAISPVWDGILIYREDTDTFRGRVNGSWVSLSRADQVVKGVVNCIGDGDPVTALALVTFPTAYATLLAGALPNVQAQVVVGAGAGAYVAGVEQLTATNMKLAVRRLDGNNISAGNPIPVHYRLELA